MFYSNGAFSLFKVDTPVISGGATPPSFQDIYSYQFDGVDDYIDCNSAVDTIKTDTQGTISAWIKISSGNSTIFTVSDISQIRRYIYLHIKGDLKLYSQLRNGGGNTSGWIIETDDSLTLNTWYHVAVVQNASSPILYVNGVEVSQTLLVGNQDHRWIGGLGFTSANNIEIGRLKTLDLNQNHFDGLIDEVSYFSSALSSTDIEAIWNNGVPNNLNELSTLPKIWYRMGESASWDGSNWTLTDQGSGGNNATTQNMPEASRVLDVPPTFNTKSILLDGIDDFVDMGNTLDFTNTDAFSISCWFKRTRNGVSEFLISKQDSTSNSRGYTLLIPFDDNKVTVVIRNNTASSGRLIVDCATAITDANWHNIVMTYDGSSNVSGINLYLDGNNDTGVTSGTLSATISNSASFQIGAKNGGNEFSGNLDEVSVFNSELSQSDVTSIYGGGVPSSLSSYSSLVSWWRCGDSDTSPILTDNGSGGNDGTMTNFSTFSTDVPT